MTHSPSIEGAAATSAEATATRRSARGSSYYAINAARARARQVEAAETRAEEGLRLEAMQAEIELDTATAQLRVAHTTVTQAEQNLELVERRFEQQAATSTDVLDAQPAPSTGFCEPRFGRDAPGGWIPL